LLNSLEMRLTSLISFSVFILCVSGGIFKFLNMLDYDVDESSRLKVFSEVAFLVILASLSIIAPSAHPMLSKSDSITVPDDYPTIQAAVDAASSGDTVYVRAGTYFEWVHVTKSLKLIGENANTTTVQSPITNYGAGIELSANNVTVTGFTIKKYATGIRLQSSYNTIEENIIMLNDDRNIYSYNSQNNTIRNNVISNATWGFDVDNWCDHNVITGNRISHNEWGLYLDDSYGNTLRDNNMTNNMYNFRVTGSNLNHYIHDIDTSNTVDGNPIYYWTDQHNKSVPHDAGCVIIVNSTNVRVKDLNLTANGEAVRFAYTSESVIENVYCLRNERNIVLTHSDMNFIRNCTSKGGGIAVWASNNNTIINNTVSGEGVTLSGASNNNTIANNVLSGVVVWASRDNSIIDNVITDKGVWLEYSSTRNHIDSNVIFANQKTRFGIRIEESGGNVFSNNTMTGDRANFGVYGSTLSHFIQDVDTSNTVNGKPIYYWINQQDKQVPLDAGYVAVVNSTNITVKNLTLTYNGQGVLFAHTSNSTIEKVNASYNEFGIYFYESNGNVVDKNVVDRNTPRSGWTGLCGGMWLRSSENNVLTKNVITSNYEGIRLYTSNSNVITENTVEYNEYGVVLTITNGNFIHHNNFINNTVTLSWYLSSDVWDDGREGNHWSDYNGVDLDGDGVGDTSLPWHGDRYPLMYFYWNHADVTRDLKVDIFDVVLACAAYGSTPSDPDWNPVCDLAEPYGSIDIYDVMIIAGSYGKQYTYP